MLADIFGTVLLPIVLIVSVGFALGRLTRVDSRPLALAVFYLFNPCLVFVSMAGHAGRRRLCWASWRC